MKQLDPKEQILRLAEERSREGKPSNTDEQVIAQMKRIRDGAAAWLEQCVIYAKPDGIKEAQSLFNYAQKQIRILSINKK